MRRIKTYSFLLFTLSCLACILHAAGLLAPDDPTPHDLMPPLEIEFESAMGMLFREDYGVPSCGVPLDREQCYDPRTGVFHISFRTGGDVKFAFGLTKVSERFTKPVVFRLTGVPLDNGCLGSKLTLTADGKDYELEHYIWGVDKTLFRVKREKDAVIVEVTKKGQTLLKPGTKVWFSVDHCW